MKRIFITIAIFFVGLTGWSQLTIQGSIQQGASANKVDVVFKPSYNSNLGEFVNSLNISIAIPVASAGSVAPTIAGTGNFSGMNFTPASPFGYTYGSDKIFTWVYSSGPTSMSWTAGSAFTGLTITFNGGSSPAKVKLVDLTNEAGGADGQTFFALTTNRPNDATDYGTYFYAIDGASGSSTGAYPGGDIFVQTNLLISLPVSLTSFNGYKSGIKNNLIWTVENEFNSKGYSILRSADGVNFSSIGFVDSKNNQNSSAPTQYQYDDLSFSGAKQYYRLKQVDIDGKTTLSNVVLISRYRSSVLSLIALYPNPAKDQVNLNIEAPARDRITILVTDAMGRIVRRQVEAVGEGSNNISLDVAAMASGNYMIKVISQTGQVESGSRQFSKE